MAHDARSVMLGLLISAGILVYLGYLVVSLLRSWSREVDETIVAGRKKGETPGRIALDVAEDAGIGAAKVAVGLAIGGALGGSAGGAAGSGGGAFGGGGAAGSW